MSNSPALVVTRLLRRVTTAALLCLVGLLLVATAANAHTTLVSMSPADGSLVTVAPEQVVLTFDNVIQAVGDAVLVTDPNGASVTEGAPVVLDDTVTQKLTPLTVPGRYAVSYRVVSADGHPVERALSFYYLQKTDPTPSPTPTPTSSSRGSPIVVWVVVGAAVILTLGVAVAWRRRSESQ
ncbi:MAG: copper resistance protein CopC [Actinobacteria bacterium]|nr:copper resistance protein CopC [Actinomycetota bacterium]